MRSLPIRWHRTTWTRSQQPHAKLLCAADETIRDLVAGANRFSIIVDDRRQLSMNVRMQPLVDPTRYLSAFRREAAKTAASRFAAAAATGWLLAQKTLRFQSAVELLRSLDSIVARCTSDRCAVAAAIWPLALAVIRASPAVGAPSKEAAIDQPATLSNRASSATRALRRAMHPDRSSSLGGARSPLADRAPPAARRSACRLSPEKPWPLAPPTGLLGRSLAAAAIRP